MKAPAASDLLIFAWNRVRRIRFVLAGFILLSLGIHLTAFFLFRVVYPAQASAPMLPPTVSLLDPARPDHQALLRWIDAEDATPFDHSGDLTGRLLEVPYRPSFATIRTAPLTLPPEPATPKFPPARDPLAWIRSTDKEPSTPAFRPPTKTTRVKFSAPLDQRADGGAELPISRQSAAPLEPTAFLLGVSDRGQVRHLIQQQSSGDPAMDAEAAAALWARSFKPGGDAIAWGEAAVVWGPEIYGRKEEPRR
jgi:hypothetical protein